MACDLILSATSKARALEALEAYEDAISYEPRRKESTAQARKTLRKLGRRSTAFTTVTWVDSLTYSCNFAAVDTLGFNICFGINQHMCACRVARKSSKLQRSVTVVNSWSSLALLSSKVSCEQ